jgi:Translationally controlled tumour protein
LLSNNTAGANPSAEEVDEAVEDSVKKVNNVIHSHNLQQTSFDKKTYLAYLKVNALSHRRYEFRNAPLSGLHESNQSISSRKETRTR